MTHFEYHFHQKAMSYFCCCVISVLMKHKADRHVSVKDIKTGTDLLRVEGAIEFVLSFAEISLKISFYTL